MPKIAVVSSEPTLDNLVWKTVLSDVAPGDVYGPWGPDECADKIHSLDDVRLVMVDMCTSDAVAPDVLEELCQMAPKRGITVVGIAPLANLQKRMSRPAESETDDTTIAMWAGITAREEAILERLQLRESNETISVGMSISFSNLKAILQEIYRKLGVHKRADAVRLFIQRKHGKTSFRPQQIEAG